MDNKYMKLQYKEHIELIVFDFDGVLTDNKVIVHEDGKEAVVCNRSDGLAFDIFRRDKIETLILSTESNRVVSTRAAKLKIPVLQAVDNKKKSLIEYCSEGNIKLDKVMYVGNDINDLSVMQIVGYPVAVADSDSRIIEVAKIVTRKRGGDGVAREICERVLGLKY